MTAVDVPVVGVSCDRDFGSWRIRLRPAGPAAELETRLGSGVVVRMDRAQPGLVLELEVLPLDGVLPEGGVELAWVLFGQAAAEAMRDGAVTTTPFVPATDGAAVHLRRLLVLAAHQQDLPAPAAVDAAREFEALSVATASPGLAVLLHHYAVTCAARAAYHLRNVVDRADLGLPESLSAFLDETDTIVRGLLGRDVRLSPSVPRPTGRVQDVALDPYVHNAEPAPRGGSGRTGREAAQVEVVAVELAFGLSDVRITGANGLHEISGDITVRPGLPLPTGSLPRLWARAVDTETGALLYEVQCQLADGRITAQLCAPGSYGEDFWIEFTHDVTSVPTGPGEARAEQARRLGARAAALQESAGSAQEWLEIARLWEQSTQIWRVAGDPARRALSAVHAIRAYRTAGPEHDRERAMVEIEARAALARLSPGWLAPDPREPAVADPLHLGSMLRSAKLTPYLNAWVVRALDEFANDARRSIAGRPAGKVARPEPARAVDDLTGLTGTTNREVRSASARARVALSAWAARTGRRRLAHSILVPIAIDFALLDERGRRELAEANQLLADPPDLRDPDDPPGASG